MQMTRCSAVDLAQHNIRLGLLARPKLHAADCCTRLLAGKYKSQPQSQLKAGFP